MLRRRRVSGSVGWGARVGKGKRTSGAEARLIGLRTNISKSEMWGTRHYTRQRRFHPMAAKRTPGRIGPFLLGVVVTLVVIVAGAYAYLHWGHPPVAAADPAFPMEAQIVHVPLEARIKREIQQPPFPASEDAFESGASIYRSKCAFCHGTPGQDSKYGAAMYPAAPQLWKKHKTG